MTKCLFERTAVHYDAPVCYDTEGAWELVCEVSVPLTPSGNRWVRMHWAARRRYGAECLAAVRAQVRPGVPIPGPVWLHLVRCSTATRPADVDNVISGAKAAIDALVMARVLVDDGPRQIERVTCDDRVRGRWDDRQGPATWLQLWRRRGARAEDGTT